MGIEARRGRAYYYRKERCGDRVISRYVGGGELGLALATMDGEDRAAARLDRERAAELWRVERERMEAEDREFAEYFDRVEMQVREMLTAAGYHRPKRQWRKRRGRAE
jgi:hypothetical protein